MKGELSMDMAAAIAASPSYQRLVRRRTRFSTILSATILALYFGYIALVAFDKSLLALPIGGGVTTIGIPIGIGIIVAAVGVTALYTVRANIEFDALTRHVTDEAQP